jgi:hypothetical protein
MFEIGFINGEKEWVKMYGDFPTEEAAKLYRMRLYMRTRHACNMIVKETEKCATATEPVKAA